MSEQNSISAGEKIELLIDKKGNPERYLSKVETVIDEETFVISRPVGDNQFTYLTLGEIIRIFFFRSDGAYYFDAQVLERIKSQSSISARLVALTEKYKMQRRNYYRLNTMVPVTITSVENGIKVSKGYDTIDISGGGLRFASSAMVDVGTEVEVSVDIEEIEDFPIKGRVVRSVPSEKDDGMYEMGVEFIKIHQKVRQVIINYIFSKQRELIKKGFKL